MKAGRIAWSVVGLLSFLSTVRGGPVTWQFTGEITRVSDPLNLLGGGVEVGSPFSGSYTFESSIPDSQPDPRQGIYNGAVVDVSGIVGVVPFSGPHASRVNRFRIDDATGGFERDHYALQVGITFVGQTLDFELFMVGGHTSALLNDALPILPPDLNLFEFRGLGISDTLEQVPILIDATLTSVVPEPTMIVMLLVGAVCASAVSRKRRCIPGARRHPRAIVGPLSVILVLLSVLLAGMDNAHAEDCNGNGIADATELAQCKVDLVFIIDTSTSMPQAMINGFCNTTTGTIATAVTQLTTSGVSVSYEVRRISPDPAPPAQFTPCTCCTSSVVEVYGTSTLGLPEGLGDCTNQEGELEDWGVAAAIVAGEKQWTSGAMRIIVPVSDEPPRCGWPVHDQPGCVKRSATLPFMRFETAPDYTYYCRTLAPGKTRIEPDCGARS